MNKILVRFAGLVLLVLALVLTAAPAAAQSNDGCDSLETKAVISVNNWFSIRMELVKVTKTDPPIVVNCSGENLSVDPLTLQGYINAKGGTMKMGHASIGEQIIYWGQVGGWLQTDKEMFFDFIASTSSN
jgi:hypothetical protein